MNQLTVVALTGLPEVQVGDDLVALLVASAREVGSPLADGDILVVSSKIVSKSLGLRADSSDPDSVVAGQTVRVVAERVAGERITRIVESAAGPVMAAAGVDASNTGVGSDLLLLPAAPDDEAERLRVGLLSATGLDRLGVVLSDTAGRTWRSGQVDFALGAAGVQVSDDLRGGTDADGRPLAVTIRALADELAAAADLVKGKASGVPAAVVRGTPWATAERGPGAASLLRTGREDWFAYGSAEAVRAALGTAPGSLAAMEDGIASTAPEPVQERVSRAISVALRGAPEAGVDTGGGTGGSGGGTGGATCDNGGGPGGDVVRVSAPTAYELGVAVARLQVALWGEGLTVEVPGQADGLEVDLTVVDTAALADPGSR